MSNTGQTTRQKLIAMMYLVMMALLALNVSHEVINAFIVVDENIILSNQNFQNKLKDIYDDFEENYVLNPEKVKPYWQRARMARFLSAQMVAYVNQVRDGLIARIEDVTIDSAKRMTVRDIQLRDESATSTNYFLGNTDDGSEGMARELKNKLIAYRKQMLELLDPELRAHTNLGLDTEGPYQDADGKEQNWEAHYFLNTIVAADVPILNKIILDIYNAELEVVTSLHKSVGQGDFKFEKVEAKVVPQSNFVFSGDAFKAEVIVAAFDTSHTPEAWCKLGVDYLDSADRTGLIPLRKDAGKLKLDLPAGEEGVKKYAGYVRNIAGNGVIRDFHFTGEYIVSLPTANISPTKMNVLYAGVENPVTIGVSGVPAEAITPVISAGSITRSRNGKEWLAVVPPNFSSTTITLYATVEGEKKNMGSQRFRVKRIPNPYASIASKSNGSINKNILIAAGVITAQMPEDFDFEYSCTVKSFTMSLQRGFKVQKFTSTNAYLTDEMIDQLRKTNRGQTVVFENIQTTDVFNFVRELTPIGFTLE